LSGPPEILGVDHLPQVGGGAAHRPLTVRGAPGASMAWIDGGRFTMGSDRHYPEEAPAHKVMLDGFWIDRYPVTNAEFSSFVDETGYVTVAERIPDARDYPGAQPEMLVPASVVFRRPDARVDLKNHFNWWTYIPCASWRHPEGPRSAVDSKMDHPVVHVTFEDAAAYAAWAGKALPTEAEWEYAARGGLEGADFAWGDSFRPQGQWMANVWFGSFPHEDRKEHGYGTSPVGQFPPNGHGLYDMIGNVWEWTTDWYSAKHEAAGGCCGGVRNPRGGAQDQSADPRTPGVKMPRKVMKGGSFLCAPNYCRRYRPAARMAQPMDTSTCHLGFRCISRTS
jgi:formylglycine-generating enzyme required for sulfatase activity